MHPLNKPRFLADGQPDWSGPRHMSDGPMYQQYFERDLLGRVVGLFIGPRARSERERKKTAAREEQLRRQPPTIDGARHERPLSPSGAAR
jgi:hypothetical protein